MSRVGYGFFMVIAAVFFPLFGALAIANFEVGEDLTGVWCCLWSAMMGLYAVALAMRAFPRCYPAA